ncbi:hypothetical protein KCP71_01635 [Salmonella enterica subsp. enterica]|nr:hypothetical protein KCP71_01635 [Salmonella enterica subsp. enterica]
MNSLAMSQPCPGCCGSGGHYLEPLSGHPPYSSRSQRPHYFSFLQIRSDGRRFATIWKPSTHNVLYLHPHSNMGGTTMPFMQQDPRRLVWQQNDLAIYGLNHGARTACAYAAAVICR